MSSLKKKATVLLLPTNKKSELFICNNILSFTNKHQNILAGVKNYPVTYQHLYIVDDSEIKEGDWVYKLDCNPKIFKWINTSNTWYKDAKKIIATTDKLTYKYNELGNELKVDYFLPKPSQQFIEKYIEQYNKGNIITDLIVDLKNSNFCLETLNYSAIINFDLPIIYLDNNI
jgi:hypothetical protein